MFMSFDLRNAHLAAQDSPRRSPPRTSAGTAAGVPIALPTDRLWTVREAAAYLSVSERYLRESSCPRVLLPGNGPRGVQLVRYDPAEVNAWEQQWRTSHADRLRRAG